MTVNRLGVRRRSSFSGPVASRLLRIRALALGVVARRRTPHNRRGRHNAMCHRRPRPWSLIQSPFASRFLSPSCILRACIQPRSGCESGPTLDSGRGLKNKQSGAGFDAERVSFLRRSPPSAPLSVRSHRSFARLCKEVCLWWSLGRAKTSSHRSSRRAANASIRTSARPPFLRPE